MPQRTRRTRWHDVDKQDIKRSSVIQLYLMYGEDRNFSPKTVRWYSDHPLSTSRYPLSTAAT